MTKHWGWVGEGPIVGRIVEADQPVFTLPVKNYKSVEDMQRGVAASETRQVYDLKNHIWRIRK